MKMLRNQMILDHIWNMHQRNTIRMPETIADPQIISQIRHLAINLTPHKVCQLFKIWRAKNYGQNSKFETHQTLNSSVTQMVEHILNLDDDLNT
jgi:hypothetical protein